MREIPLTQGQVALVDDEDYHWLSRFTWHAQKWSDGSDKYYAVTNIGKYALPMHVLIMARTHCDHRDRNGLNNQKENLRVASRSQNGCNRVRAIINKTGYRGVHEMKSGFQPRISMEGKTILGPILPTKKEAALEYNNMAEHFHGDFAILNIIKD